MKRIASILFFYLLSLSLYSQDYYVSSTTGNDNNNGLTDGTAWASISKAISAAGTGDVIGLKGGDEFFGTIPISNKNGIVLTSYGTGKAIIRGSKEITGWTNEGSNIWSLSTGVDNVYQVLKNKTPIHLASKPVIAGKYAREDNWYRVDTNVSSRVFQCDDLIGSPDLVGASVHVMHYEYSMITATIAAFNSGTGRVTLDSDAYPGAGDRFIINNHYNLLANQDDWYYDSGTLYVYSATEPTNISISTVDDHGLDFRGGDQIRIENLTIRDFNNAGIHSHSTRNVTVNNVDFLFNNVQGVFTEKGSGTNTTFTIDNCYFKGGRTGVLSWGDNLIVTNSEMRDIGLLEYMVVNGYGDGARIGGAVGTSFTTCTYTGNEIHNIGYNGLRVGGQNSLVNKNFITEPCLTMHDGGGIYTWAGSSSNPGAQNSIIEENTVLCDMANIGDWTMQSIYMDDYAHDIIIRDNNLSGGLSNINLHNTKNITVTRNKCYLSRLNNFRIKEDKYGEAGYTTGNIITDNQYFSNSTIPGQKNMLVENRLTKKNLGMGTYDNNIYYSTEGTDVILNVRDWSKGNWSQDTLAEWQTYSGQDANSTSNTTPWTIEESFFAYNETGVVKVVTLTGGTWTSLTGTTYSGTITLQPYSSEILILSEKSTGSVTASAGSDVSICNGESTTLTASGGSSYLWSTGVTTASITVNPDSTQTYSVTAKDVSGNSDTDDVIVTVNTVTANAGVDKTITEGDSVTLTASGGDTYTWNTGDTGSSITVTPTSTSDYTVTVTKNGCSDTDSVKVIVNPTTGSVNANAGSDVAICNGGSTLLTASGGSSYTWNTGATTASITVNPDSTQTYSVTAKDVSGNSDTDDVIVTVNTVTANAGVDKTITEGDSVTLTASGGDTYTWNTGDTGSSITVSPTSTLDYTVTVTKDGCDDTDIVRVIVNPTTGTVNAYAGSDVAICNGGSTVLTASGGSSYTWSTGATTASITVSPNTTQTYTVTARDGSGNTDTDDVIVTVNSVTANAGVDKTITEGDSVTLTASGGDTYTWNTGDTGSSITVSPTSTSDYTVTVTKDGCDDTDSVKVIVNPTTGSVTANAGSDVAICNGGSTVLTASGGSSYTWSTGGTTASITVSPNTTQTYTVTAKDGSGNTDTDEVIVTVNSVTANAGTDRAINEGESIKLTANGGDTYRWSTGAISRSITVSPTSTTTYTVIVNKDTCEDSDSILITVNNVIVTNPMPAAAFAGDDISICLGESLTLNASGGDTYSWSTGENDNNINVSPTRSTTYILTATRGGTIDTDTVTVTVENCNISVLPEDALASELSIYPNPTTGLLNINVPNITSDMNVELISLNGSLVYKETMYKQNNGFYEVDLSRRLAKGVYFVRIFNTDQYFIEKIILN